MQKRRLVIDLSPIVRFRATSEIKRPDPALIAGLATLRHIKGIQFEIFQETLLDHERDVGITQEITDAKLQLIIAPEPELIKFAMNMKPEMVYFGKRRPEGQKHATLDVFSNIEHLKTLSAPLRENGIGVGAFTSPDIDVIRQIHRLEFQNVLFSALGLIQAPSRGTRHEELQRIMDAARLARKFGLNVGCAKGLTYANAADLSAIEDVLDIVAGEALFARALFTGLESAVDEFAALSI
ncbi:MAG: pyridoxine 5'-phosphate synthase [Myxococcota bacterium]|nr:pyridoxine 5'-phosphate synthase [Myxococcota bacterium]